MTMKVDSQMMTAHASAFPSNGVTLKLPNGWDVELHSLGEQLPDNTTEGIILASIPLAALYIHDGDAYRAFTAQGGGRDGTDCASSDAIKIKAAQVALADYTARTLEQLLPLGSGSGMMIRTMGQSKCIDLSSYSRNETVQRKSRRRNGLSRKGKTATAPIPFVLERTDCTIASGNNPSRGASLQLFLHATCPPLYDSNEAKGEIARRLSPVLDRLRIDLASPACYAHVACVVLQCQLRSMLQPPVDFAALARDGRNDLRGCCSASSAEKDGEEEKIDDGNGGGTKQYLDAVAFIADGSLLPRRSGRSTLPMASPPAVPFSSPESKQLMRVVTVEVGQFWRRHLQEDGSTIETSGEGSDATMVNALERANHCPRSMQSTITMRGMIIPRGVTLIVGGGYHGKSTLLQALCMGIYDTIPGDGRERCVSHSDAVSIRAEDGRYVNNVNVSAFISNLPSGRSVNGASIPSNQDTARFSTRDASGSTSQAANVIEALECGASALLVDEDVSAANFMARDGRMRAMIMDEPITPLLYRVNGLFLSREHHASTVVVVGGVGEWLDVADAVILMKNYVAYDGLKKARSVSYQFSYGHVQYAGRGVVHRLPWEAEVGKKGLLVEEGDSNVGKGVMWDLEMDKKTTTTTLSPLRRSLNSDCIKKKFQNAAVHLPQGTFSRLWFYGDAYDDGDASKGVDNDDDDGMVDMSKCSQLVGDRSEQLYGCGICVLWLIRESQRRPEEDLSDLLTRMEHELDKCGGGLTGLLAPSGGNMTSAMSPGASRMPLAKLVSSHDFLDLLESVGCAFRPRKHEVAMVLTRMRGMTFHILPEKPKAMAIATEEAETKRLEEESKKRALAELWANRRKR